MNLTFVVPPACLSLHQNNLLCPSSNNGTQTTLICGDDATAILIGLELIGAARQMYGCNRPLNVGKRSGKIVITNERRVGLSFTGQFERCK